MSQHETIRLFIEVPEYASIVTGADRDALEKRAEAAIAEVLDNAYIPSYTFRWEWPAPEEGQP